MADKHTHFRVLDHYKTPCCPVSIPWEMIAPFEPNAKRNHDQDLHTLHHRGGLSPLEIYAVMTGKRWGEAARLENMTEEDGAKWLVQELAKYLATQSSKEKNNG